MNEEGGSLAEYGLLIALVCLACIVSLMYTNISLQILFYKLVFALELPVYEG